jgi:hypothetical protein
MAAAAARVEVTKAFTEVFFRAAADIKLSQCEFDANRNGSHYDGTVRFELERGHRLLPAAAGQPALSHTYSVTFEVAE